MRHYQQLTYEQRCQIYVLKKRGYSQREIATSIGVSQSTVNRERIRNKGARDYRYKQAQERASRRRYKASKVTKSWSNTISATDKKLRSE